MDMQLDVYDSYMGFCPYDSTLNCICIAKKMDRGVTRICVIIVYMSFSRSSRFPLSDKEKILQNINDLHIKKDATFTYNERLDILNHIANDLLSLKNVKKILGIFKQYTTILNSVISKINNSGILETKIDPHVIQSIINHTNIDTEIHNAARKLSKESNQRSTRSHSHTNNSKTPNTYDISKMIAVVLYAQRNKNTPIDVYERKLRGLSTIREDKQYGGEPMTLVIIALIVIAGVALGLLRGYMKNRRPQRLVYGGKNTIKMPKKYYRNRRTVRVK